jgi:hypothetical protein
VAQSKLAIGGKKELESVLGDVMESNSAGGVLGASCVRCSTFRCLPPEAPSAAATKAFDGKKVEHHIDMS